MSYYTAVLALCWIALIVLCILVYENDRIKKKDKRIFYLTYITVAVSAFAEWLGFRLSGNPSISVWALRAVKCMDFVLTPVIGGAMVTQLRRNSVWQKLIWTFVAWNAMFQFIAMPFDWMVVIDKQNNFSGGPMYPIYSGMFLLYIFSIGAEFISYGKRFRRQNRLSLYASLGLVAVGVFIQEVISEELRTDYLALTFGMALLYIHNMEFSQLASDDALNRQLVAISTDAMTGVSSRYAYEEVLKKLNTSQLPERFAVFSIDINGLKRANDMFGHKSGDDLICAAADCIKRVFAKSGVCYRTGGDEFIVLTEADRHQAYELLAKLRKEASIWHGRRIKTLSMAAAFALAADHPGYSCEKLIAAADQAMYAEKRAYYQEKNTG